MVDDNLPGLPDNIRASADGRTVLVALAGKCGRPLCALHEVLTRPQLARVANVVYGKLLFRSVESAEAAVRKLNIRRVEKQQDARRRGGGRSPPRDRGSPAPPPAPACVHAGTGRWCR